MRALIVEDDPASRGVLLQMLSVYGHCDTAVNGKDAVDSFRRSIDESTPYDLICMDIMMPKVDGHQALRQIREIEKQAGIPVADAVKVIMTTALNDTDDISQALFNGGACGYFVKPLEVDDLIRELKQLRLIAEE